MRSLFHARWGALLAAGALALAAAPAAQAVPPNTHPNNGSYASQTPITISFVSDQPVTIHYTTDGLPATANSPTYSSPLTFTRTTLLKWLATNSAGESTSGAEIY